jgi:hypothetical protein
MGTRNSVIVIVDNEPKIAKYCQWDGYPSGRGIELLRVLQKHTNLELMKEKVKAVKSLTDEEVNERWKQAGADGSGWATLTVADKFKKTNAHLSRDMGGEEVLDLVMNGDIDETYLNPNFVADSLFCEWAYVVDLDKKTFEVYKGFNDHTPLTPQDRFFDKTKQGAEYHPVKLLVEYSLIDLPSGDKFLDDTTEKDEEDEE